MLFLFSFEIEAASLQNAFEDLLLLIKRNKAEIWKFASAGNMFRTEIGPQSTVNSILENMQRKTETEQCNGTKIKIVSIKGFEFETFGDECISFNF